MTEEIYAGIDPGITGALAIITVKNGIESARVHDFQNNAITKLSLMIVFNHQHLHILIESVHSRRGWALGKNDKLMKNIGEWHGVIKYLRGEYPAEILPKVWQKTIWGNNTTPDDTTRKKMSLAKVRELFPHLAEMSLNLEKHHNRGDALLIAKCCQIANS